ncbi:MAG TPA: hypothetical protein VMU65_14745, partial [Candidatus Saccharimonadales bacterium]|nr:hypothetical protein [Candidatus Saccharimonadales bacterium]
TGITLAMGVGDGVGRSWGAAQPAARTVIPSATADTRARVPTRLLKPMDARRARPSHAVNALIGEQRANWVVGLGMDDANAARG